jgi:hypothetical protein
MNYRETILFLDLPHATVWLTQDQWQEFRREAGIIADPPPGMVCRLVFHDIRPMPLDLTEADLADF